MNIQQSNVVDGYKLGHIDQYIEGTQVVSSNLTPRSDRLARVIREHFNGKVTFFGLQYAIKVMKQNWQTTFFDKPKKEAVEVFARRVKNYLGPDNGDSQIEAMGKLHDLGYLPLEIKALPEGAQVNMQVPVFTVKNTHNDFYWLTNYCETFLSCMVWPFCNAAEVSRQYYETSKRWASVTGAPDEWLGIANHCFAARGHRGMEDAMMSGMGALLFSYGTDTLWAIDGMEEYYNADSDKELIACSVNAFEHATATQRIAFFRNNMGYAGMQAEVESLRDITTNLYPKGIVSYVADSEDYFGLLEQGLPQIKDEILNRTEDSLGLCKFVLRPDSSPKTPLEVICGDVDYIFSSMEEAETEMEDVHMDMAREDCEGSYSVGNEEYLSYVKVDGVFYIATTKFEYDRHDKKYYYVDSHSETILTEVPVNAEMKGSLQLLWDTFGGSLNDKGYKVLNPKVGIIYGEAITIEMQDEIYKRMEKDGWCVSNVLMGVGSWGFLDRSSRDSYNFAIKGTNSIVNGEEVSMQKNPKTAQNSKKSAKGLLRVELEGHDYVLYDEQTSQQEQQGELKTVFLNGDLVNETSLAEVRARTMK